MIEPAIDIVSQADIIVVIGTSLAVYPAASLLHYANSRAQVYYIDPHPAAVPSWVKVIEKGASQGMKELIETLK